MKLDKLLELTKENYYLHETTYLPRIAETNFRKKLTKYYNSELEEVRIMGSVLNSIYTEGKTTFYFSKRSLEKLIENDLKNLHATGRPKISLGKDGHKINMFRQKLVEMFKAYDSFSLIKEASIKFKTPSVVEFDDDDLYGMMDELGEVTKRLKTSFKNTALDSILKIEQEMVENEAEMAPKRIPKAVDVLVTEPDEDQALDEYGASNKLKPEGQKEIDLEVDLSVDNDDWIHDHLSSLGR